MAPFQITTFLLTDGTVKISMMSSANTLTLSINVKMNPFKVVIDTVTYGANMANPPVANGPFDLLITCGPDNFKVYIDGQGSIQ